MTTMWMIWIFVAAVVCSAILMVVNTVIAIRKHNNTATKSIVTTMVIVVKKTMAIIFVIAIPVMLRHAITKDTSFFYVFLESEMRWLFYTLAIMPIYLIISRKEISRDIKRAIAIVRNE